MPHHICLSSLYFQGRGRQREAFDKRLIQPTTRNVMRAVLLTPGPISTRLTTRNMSSSFKVAVTKPKFLAAATQLQKANLGYLLQWSCGTTRTYPIFIKRLPLEMTDVLKMEENSDLCTPEEYEFRFKLPTPASIKEPMQEDLIRQGLVHPQHFKRALRVNMKTE